MKQILITAAIACSLAACGNADSDLISKAQKAVQAKLKDPDSAKFGEAFVLVHEENPGEDSGIRKVCGDVAAKNSYGAYDGRIRFVAFFGKPLGSKDIELLSLEIEKKPNDRIFEIVNWQIDCKKQSSS
ncbi:hypothetical protein [Comamonas thiooxydans]|uniref:hypothetical protein n=1 Tax=Comamonas thiooxydans TaxID=363952 RepID=UPI001CCCA130|nr:hypothetical protein [Comamonas thiooxydans]UBQ43968.1 hypothetical protein LCH15_11085 [Comamonas thiooxydans]